MSPATELVPARIKQKHMGASPAKPVNYNLNYRLDHFSDYRNDTIARMLPSRYGWGGREGLYTPHPDASIYKNRGKHYHVPDPEFSLIDRGRMREVHDFYIVSQMHRDEYRDDTGTLYPMNFFDKKEYVYQCPRDPTSQYMTYPYYHVKYKHPYSLPVTLGSTINAPLLPDRALTGVFDNSSDFRWKR